MRRHAFLLSMILLGLGLLGVFLIALRPPLKVVDMRLAQIPMQMEALVATELYFDDSVYSALNADGNVFRDYAESNGNPVNLYIGYYGTARGGRAEHLPQYCFTGQGWSIEKWDFVTLNVPGSTDARVNRMVVNKGANRRLVYFWFQSEDTVMSTGWEQNWFKFQHRLQRGRNDGTLVRVAMDLPRGRESEVEARAQHFSKTLIPLIAEYWPIESKMVDS